MQRKNARNALLAKYAASIRQMKRFPGKGHASPYCKSCSRLKRCRKSGGNGYKPDDGLPYAAAFRRREEVAAKEKCTIKCRKVADTAKGDYNECFPYAETHAMKKAAMS